MSWRVVAHADVPAPQRPERLIRVEPGEHEPLTEGVARKAFDRLVRLLGASTRRHRVALLRDATIVEERFVGGDDDGGVGGADDEGLN